jgi:succinoglycan biosynthesis transport protein ExoP
MTRKIPASLREYRDMFFRRKWWILVPVIAIPIVVLAASLMLPKHYRSETLILVEPQKVPEEYVHATVTTDVTDRLQTISEEVMSRTRLQTIIDDLHLYPKLQGRESKDEIVAAMRKDIVVDVVSNTHPEKHSVGAFKIAYIGDSPELAQRVTNKIADLFIQENLKVRDQQAQGTSQFIHTELDKARADLAVEEEKIRQFKAAHLGSLPEQSASNLQLISQYQSLAQANSEAIDRANQQRVYLQSMLNMSGANKGQVAAVAPPPTPLQLELQKARQELSAARQKYTESHPDITRLKAEVASLEEQVKNQPQSARAEASAVGPNMVQQLQSQLVSIDQEIKARTQRQKVLEAQLGALEGRVETLPTVESQFADQSRDYEAKQKNYQSLVEKQAASEMAAELERHDESEQFRILDPANLPSKPYSPNLPVINGAGLLGALFVGCLLAFWMELKDGTIHDADELTQYLAIPLLTTVPNIPKGVSARRSAMRSLAEERP